MVGSWYLARLRGLHDGALLPEDRYEPWADARRAALTELHTALCLELAELHGDVPAAVVALQRALVADPLAEPAHRALMRLYARTGRRQQALARTSIDRRDRRWLERLRDARSERFKAGIVIHAGAQTTPLGDRLWAVPFSGLWT